MPAATEIQINITPSLSLGQLVLDNQQTDTSCTTKQEHRLLDLLAI